VAQRYEELWHEVELADRLGFDYAFSVEHHFSPEESWMPSPTIFCTGAGLRTRWIRVGVLGYVPPLYNPIRVAEEVAALDHVLRGRLDVGLASGVTPDFFRPYGADFAERKSLTRECIDLLRTALTSDGPFDFEGPAHRFENVTLSFRPFQRPHPPLWVPTADRNFLRYLAEIGAHTASTMIVPRRALKVVYRHYVNWWRAAGHPGAPNIGYWTLVYVAPTDAEARSRGIPHIIHALTKTLRYGQNDPLRAGTPAARSSELSTAMILDGCADPDFLLEKNLVFVGSPQTVTRQIREAAEEGWFNTLLAELNMTTMSKGELESSVELFTSEVVPALRSYEPY
jgi:alkanesulfonate monooxygenase SsuD/methylene tetrahydromethanopterin reductase-like flavin-dependent oxidoreductase (luciferase family)